MAVKLASRVAETTTTSGTGTIDLDGPKPGFLAFLDGQTGISSGAQVYYAIEDGSAFEVGRGTLTQANPNTLARDAVLVSSNAGAKINLSGSEATVFLALPGEKALALDESGKVQGDLTFAGTIDFAGSVGLGIASPDGLLHVHTASAGSITASSVADDLVVENNAAGGISVLTPNTAAGNLFFADPQDNNAGGIQYDHAADELIFLGKGVGSAVGRFDADGHLLVGTGVLDAALGAATKVQIEGANSGAIGNEMLLHNPSAGSGAAVALTFGGKASGTEGYNAILKTEAGVLRIGVQSATSGFVEPPALLVIQPDGFGIRNGTGAPGGITDGVVLYSEDVSASAELKVVDEAGNRTTLSPHSFPLVPGGPSEPMAWAYYSERDGRAINVDMLALARAVEALTGRQLVYEARIA